ncbi:MAG TPA: hypothetical protein VJ919_14770 [Tangfeifania sp.]|nr:hypothetical protein [Tangfeifania sp.]
MKKLLLFIFSIVFAIAATGQQLKIELEGNATFGNSNFSVGEAGEDFPANIENETSFFISVLYTDDNLNRKKNPNTKWNIKVYKSDLTWNNDLKLEARRTGRGQRIGNPGNPNVHDGDNYQFVTNTSTYFFRGMGEVAYIPVTFNLSGFSLTMGASTYETRVVFTVYDDW